MNHPARAALPARRLGTAFRPTDKDCTVVNAADQAAIDAIADAMENMTEAEIMALGAAAADAAALDITPTDGADAFTPEQIAAMAEADPTPVRSPEDALAEALAYRATKRAPVAPIESKRSSTRPPCGGCKYGIRKESKPTFDGAGVQYHPNCLKAKESAEFRSRLAPRYVAAIVPARAAAVALPKPEPTTEVAEAEAEVPEKTEGEEAVA